MHAVGMGVQYMTIRKIPKRVSSCDLSRYDYIGAMEVIIHHQTTLITNNSHSANSIKPRLASDVYNVDAKSPQP